MTKHDGTDEPALPSGASIVLVILLLAMWPHIVWADAAPGDGGRDVRLRIVDRQIVDGSGQSVPLRGIYSRAEWLKSEQEVKQFKRWGVNFVRLLLTYDKDYWQVVNNGEFDVQKRCMLRDENLPEMDMKVRWLEDNQIYYMVEVHWRALGLTDELDEPELLADQFSSFYRRLAQRYRHLDYLMGYCMFSEIYVKPADYADYRKICTAIVDAVHEVDPGLIMSVTGVQTSGPGSMVDAIHVDRPSVMYDFHFYSPTMFTHYRKVYGDLRYPGWIADGYAGGVTLVDLDYLEDCLAPALRFSRKWCVPIWCGEFGAFNHAPDNSSERWERDMVRLFERERIPWIFWTWRPDRTDVPTYWKELWWQEAPDYRTVIVPHGGPFAGSTEVRLRSWLDGAEIRYTLDGREPDEESALYTKPFRLETNTTVRARAFKGGVKNCPVDVASFYELPMRQAENPNHVAPGLRYWYHEGQTQPLDDLESQPATRTGIAPQFDRSVMLQENNVSLKFSGFLEIVHPGIYYFYTSDAGRSQVRIGDQLVVDNPTSRWISRKTGYIALDRGRHAIEVVYQRADQAEVFYSADRKHEWFMVEYEGPGLARQVIPPSVLCHLADDASN